MTALMLVLCVAGLPTQLTDAVRIVVLGTDYLLMIQRLAHLHLELCCFAFWNPSIIFTCSSILVSLATRSFDPRSLDNAAFSFSSFKASCLSSH